jgi:hypothetical protein
MQADADRYANAHVQQLAMRQPEVRARRPLARLSTVVTLVRVTAEVSQWALRRTNLQEEST